MEWLAAIGFVVFAGLLLGAMYMGFRMVTMNEEKKAESTNLTTPDQDVNSVTPAQPKRNRRRAVG